LERFPFFVNKLTHNIKDVICEHIRSILSKRTLQITESKLYYACSWYPINSNHELKFIALNQALVKLKNKINKNKINLRTPYLSENVWLMSSILVTDNVPVLYCITGCHGNWLRLHTT